MALNWKQFSFREWSTFSFTDWSTFLFTPSVPLSSTTVPLGTLNMAVSTASNGSLIFNFANTTSGVETSVKLLIGGMPLSLVRIGGKYAIQYITAPSTSLRTQQLIISGNPFLVNQDSNYNYYLTGQINTDSGDYDETVLMGIPLAINSDLNLIIQEKTGTITAYGQCMWNGTPLRIGLIGNNWYFVLTEY